MAPADALKRMRGQERAIQFFTNFTLAAAWRECAPRGVCCPHHRPPVSICARIGVLGRERTLRTVYCVRASHEVRGGCVLSGHSFAPTPSPAAVGTPCTRCTRRSGGRWRR